MKEQRALAALRAYLNDSSTVPLVSEEEIEEAEKLAQEVTLDFNEKIKDEEDNPALILLRTYVQTAVTANQLPPKKDVVALRKMCMAEPRIDYKLFRIIKDQSPESVQAVLQPDVFLMFRADKKGQIASEELAAYIRHYFLVQEMRALLTTYMRTSPSHITEVELRRFMYDILPRLGYHDPNDPVRPFYARGAVKKFLFELDTNRTRRIRLDTLLSSNVFREFLTLMKEVEDNVDIQHSRIWFSELTQTALYEKYLQLDVNMDGLLSESEIMMYGGFNTDVIITPVILDMIFSVYLPYADRVVDYDAFIEIVLAFEYRDSPAGLQYLWRLCDVSFAGGMSATDIRHLYRSIASSLNEPLPDEVDVVNEIFDMANVRNGELITRERLRATNMERIVIPILTDAHTFWRYENREVHPNDDQDDEQY